MPLALYIDEHVPKAITISLRIRDIDIITAQEDSFAGSSDSELLDRAHKLNRVLFTNDDDLLKYATEKQRIGGAFSGVIFAHHLRVSIGKCVRDLEIISKSLEPDDLANRVEFLPL